MERKLLHELKYQCCQAYTTLYEEYREKQPYAS